MTAVSFRGGRSDVRLPAPAGSPRAARCEDDSVRRSAMRRPRTKVHPSSSSPVSAVDATVAGTAEVADAPSPPGRAAGEEVISVNPDDGATGAAAAAGDEPAMTTDRPKDLSSCTNWDALMCSKDALPGTGAPLTFCAYDTVGWVALYTLRASLKDRFLVTLIEMISCSFTYIGHFLSYDGCGFCVSLQFTQRKESAWQSSSKCSTDAHFPHTGRLRQCVRVCPNRWHLKQRIGLGT